MSSRQCIHLDVYGKVPVDNLYQLHYPLRAGGALVLHQTRSIPSLGGWAYESAVCLSNYMESKNFEDLKREMKKAAYQKENTNKKRENFNNVDDWLLELGAGVGIVGLVYYHHANKLYTPSNKNFIQKKINETTQINGDKDIKTPKCSCIITELSPLVPLIQFNIDQNSTHQPREHHPLKLPSETHMNISETNTNASDNGLNASNGRGGKVGSQGGELESSRESVHAMPLCWGDDEMIYQVLNLMRSKRKKGSETAKLAFFDVVILANCIYYESSLESLLHTILQVTDSSSLVLASYELKSKEIEKLIDRWHALIKAHFCIFEIDSEMLRKEVKDLKYFKDYVKLFYMRRK